MFLKFVEGTFENQWMRGFWWGFPCMQVPSHSSHYDVPTTVVCRQLLSYRTGPEQPLPSLSFPRHRLCAKLVFWSGQILIGRTTYCPFIGRVSLVAFVVGITLPSFLVRFANLAKPVRQSLTLVGVDRPADHLLQSLNPARYAGCGGQGSSDRHR